MTGPHAPVPPRLAPASAATALPSRIAALAVAAGVTAFVSASVALIRFVGNWVNAAHQSDSPAGWPYAAWPTTLEVLFALIAVGCAVAAVVPKPGRRPIVVGVLVATALVAGAALTDGMYQIVTSAYYR